MVVSAAAQPSKTRISSCERRPPHDRSRRTLRHLATSGGAPRSGPLDLDQRGRARRELPAQRRRRELRGGNRDWARRTGHPTAPPPAASAQRLRPRQASSAPSQGSFCHADAMKLDDGGAPRRRSFVQGFAYGSATFVATALVSLISAVATARLYGVNVIGQYALAYAPVGIVWYLSTIQEQPALVRKLTVLQPRTPRVTALWLPVVAFSQALSTLVVLIAGAISVAMFRGPVHDPRLIAPALTMLGGYLVLANPGWNVDTVLASFRAAPELLAVRFHQAAAFVVVAAALRLVTPSIWGLVAALVFSYGSALVHRAYVGRRFLTRGVSRDELRAGWAELREIVVFGLKVTPGVFATGISMMSGTWILGSLVSESAVGGWSRASTISQRLNDLNSRIVDMLLPTLVRRRADGDMVGFHRALVDSMRYAAVILLLPAAIAGGAAGGILTLLFGSGFANASGALVWLALVPVMWSVITFGSQALLAFNRPITTTVLEGARMAITVGLGVALTAAYGSSGMGAAMLLGCLAEATAVLILMTRQLESPIRRLWPPRALFGVGLAFAAGFAAAHFTSLALPGAGGTVLAVITGASAYLVCVVGLGGVLPRDRQRITEIIAARRSAVARRKAPSAPSA